ncbi:hypothetical protein DPMN_103960 [Dreissena polymorpha]|uniref:Uncharacterized protein n=1 Tax=Dreissena polymorpha TaxID=45954 RepID=A0A9D4HC35_DREPO|nr:hypothetical protein DPMN_103960 [Dreissena polymorpha]
MKLLRESNAVYFGPNKFDPKFVQIRGQKNVSIGCGCGSATDPVACLRSPSGKWTGRGACEPVRSFHWSAPRTSGRPPSRASRFAGTSTPETTG